MESVIGLAGKLAVELISPVFKKYIAQPWAHGSEDEFEKLKKTMDAIKAVLLDAEERQQTNNQIQHWLREIKRVFYDVEDLLQEVTTKALTDQAKTRKRKRGDKEVLISFSRPNTLNIRLDMGRKVKSIRENLDAIFLDSKIFNFTWRDESRSNRRVETHSFVPVEKFIGRENDKKYVTKLLVESNVTEENVSVVSVVGIGGMGKTTLAQSVFDSEEVKSKFELRMWVCVSDPFCVKLICENIIMSATHDKCERLSMEVVKEKLKSSIDGRKYLLVLDDVWNDKQMEWEKLEVLLAGGARGSKILITARAELVARAAKSIETHVLKGLSHDESWALLKQIAFKRGVEQVSPTMERIGKEILEKCVGVPLVVKAMGSILALKEKENDWLEFKKYDLARVTQDSEGSILPILKLSYDYLPAHLKRCFVYCAIYPKDHEIEKDELIGMWMAHGLIHRDGTTRPLEDIGERHFMDLLDRSFFEIHKRARAVLRGYGDHEAEIITFYKMHDLIHDLAQSAGGDEYYNNLGWGADYIVQSTRHAWVSRDDINICSKGEKLRTLVFPFCSEQKLNELTTKFVQLRVLRLRNIWSNSTVLQCVGGLKHLYYLDLSENYFSTLPESICGLYNLQTLVLHNCHRLEELPAGTRDLVSLRRLDFGGCSLRYMPTGVGDLTCLQTLSEFIAGGKREEGRKRKCAEVCELKSLVNLRGSLAITNLSGGSNGERNKISILKELKLVKQLELKWNPSFPIKEEEELLLIESLKPHPNLERLIIEEYPGRKVPSWMDRVHIGVSLPNIVYIKLYGCTRLRHVAALGLLPCLQQLHLGNMLYIEYLIDSTVLEETDKVLFPSLKELYLSSMSELKRLVEPSRSTTNKQYYFPVLEKLEIKNCPLFLSDGSNEDVKLFDSLRELRFLDTDEETLPSWVQYVPHLQTLLLYNCYRIVSLPEWMGNLTSLQQLRLEYLNSLASIPDCLERLTSLQRLVIRDFRHELVSRCEKEAGVDWHKIAHIPNINVSGHYDLSDPLPLSGVTVPEELLLLK